eukprot:8031698-Pyramimonas_sp.AAC.1
MSGLAGVWRAMAMGGGGSRGYVGPHSCRRQARGGHEKEKAFSEGGGASQKASSLLRGFLSLRGRP